ncbi:LysR substrate-binding domain-containing protein [Sphingomonas sanxanigenens]|uniref:HTH lysR-type domain-containing protein n=1 Tax=Sphingomonas sanxanigenens DSM 19645 = NX02 TaxID=1123269 RepID=W0ACH0_9SPHN|nr:LysR substrate-binding domain-containing protein [Sphingomonas sanxanigenens]AHE53380.1 hypothetical protein NX02_08280 [Sphingomonas sanxanigenens DSM 19645 = NX02]
MLRNAPPLESIEIFVAAAHGQSFRAVARKLALSPSAVSRRIAGLEVFLGTALFDRSAPAPVLSAEGRRYLALVEPAIATIRGATVALREGEPERLRIATSHSLAATWLMPRAAALRRDHGLDIDVLPTRSFDALRADEAHLAIWGGLEVPDDMIADHLFEAQLMPVAAPRLADGRLPPTSEAELGDFPLLAVSTPERIWERFLAGAGLFPARLDLRRHATLQLMYEAAVAGAGVGLAMPLVAEPFLNSGRLVPCAAMTPRSIGEIYRIYRPARRAARSSAEHRFAGWLAAEVRHSLDGFAALAAMRPVDAANRAVSVPPGTAADAGKA